MKRLGILIAIFISLTLRGGCFAQSQFADSISRMEKSLFGMEYSSQTDEQRVKRIEESVYGEASSKPMQVRVSKLSQDLAADLMGQEIKPKSDTFAEDEDAYKEEIPKADASVNYPVVDALEKSVFNQIYKTTEINQRLANLEQKLYKKTYNDDLNSRVSRLKNSVSPQIAQPNSNDDNYSDSDSFAYSDEEDSPSMLAQNAAPSGFGANIPGYNKNNSVLDDYTSENSDIAIPLSALEKKILKHTYPNDVVNNRLLRLELKVFNSSFTEDDSQTRLDRIASAHQAQKSSSKYDDNKFARHAATAMQIGAFLLMILAAVL